MSNSHDTRRTTGEIITIGDFLDFARRRKVTIGATFLMVMVLTILHTLSRTPTFESSATLLLEDGKQAGGLLSDLATLNSASASAKEMAILRLRSIAEEVAREPEEWTPRTLVFESTPADYFQTNQPPHLGLTTRVWAEDLSVWKGMSGRLTGTRHSPHRLFVSFEDEPLAPMGELRIGFPGPDRVRISLLGPLGFGVREEVERNFAPGAILDYGGIRMRLDVAGDYVGKNYRVQRVPLRAAVEDLMARVSVHETARNSGVLILTVEDIDPDRAAETANAIVRSYIERSIEIGGRRATKTMDFLETELDRVTTLLHQAEQEVVELSAQHSRGINVQTSSDVTIQQIANYETEKVALRLARMALEEANELLLQGEYEAVARLSNDLPDIVTLGYVATIGELSADALQLERSDAGPYKRLLQERTAGLEADSEQVMLRMASLRGARAAIESGREEALAQLAAIAGDRDGLDAISGGYVSQIAALDAELAGLGPVITDKHPEYAAKSAARAALLQRADEHLASQIEGLELAIAARTKVTEEWQRRIDAWPVAEGERIAEAIEQLRASIIRNIGSQIEGISSRLDALEETTEVLERELASLPEEQRILAESTRHRETYAQVAKVLMEGLQQAQLTRASTLPSAVLADPAVPSLRPARPSLVVNVTLGAILALVLGLGLARLRDALSDGIHTQAEVEETTGLPAIGSVPDLRRGRVRRSAIIEGFAHVRDDPGGFEAEVFRSIRENLRFAAEPGEELRTFAVTSATPNEGKTLMNVNLALTFASSESRVLLVDADMRKPSVRSFFNLEDGPGFRDVLEGADWRTAVQPSMYEGLDVLPSDVLPGSASDLLRGGRVREVVGELRAEYDRVVFDLPPVMVAADVETFAVQLDGVVLLVRSDVVPRRYVLAAAGRLRRSGIRLLGTILNAVRSERHGYSYGYSKGGGYGGHGYGAERAAAPLRRSAG